MKVRAWVLAVALLVAPSAFAQTGGPDGGSFAIREDFARVAPAQGPAWWKVSTDASVVWIMGAPPPRLEGWVNWDKTALLRRLKGARLILLPRDNKSSFVEGGDWAAVRRRLEQDVVTARNRAGRRPERPDLKRYQSALQARDDYLRQQNKLTRAHEEIAREAERSRAPIVRSPVSQYPSPDAGPPSTDLQVVACIKEALAFAAAPPKTFNLANQSWAVGDVPGMMQALPKGFSPVCRGLWHAQRQENIAFQTQVVMEALRRPGKVVAVYPIDNLIAKDGILARLQARGYTVADPSLPLSEE